MANIFNLFGEVFVETDKAQSSIDKITNKGKEADVSLGQKFGNIAKNAVAIGSAVVGAASVVGGGLMRMVMSSSDTLGALDDAAQRVGMTAEAYQEWAYVAKQSGLEVGKLEAAMKKQQTVFSDAVNGSKTASAAYSALGIDITKIGTASEAFDVVMARLSQMDDETQRNAIANDLFGKSYADLIPVLNQGADGMNNIKQEAHDLGGVISNEAVQGAADFGDAIERLKTGFAGMSNNLMAGLMPVAQTIVDMLVEYMPQINTMFQSMAPMLTSLFENLLPPLINLAQMLLPSIIELVNMVLPILMDVLNAIMPIVTLLIQSFLPPLMDLIKTILPVLMPLLRTFASIFTAVLTPAIQILSSVVSGLITIFKNVFNSLYEIVKVPINFMIGGINKFIEGLNKIKIPDWVPIWGGKNLNIPLIRKLQIGIDSVPFDNYPALLHKGEGILTAEENKNRKQTQSIDPEALGEAVKNAISGMRVILDGEKVGTFVDTRIMKGATV